MPLSDRKVLQMPDNQNVHKAITVHEWLTKNEDWIEEFYLPPYSPELYSMEYFNGDLKGAIQRGIPPNEMKDLKRTELRHSHFIQRSPDRVRAYFNNRRTNDDA